MLNKGNRETFTLGEMGEVKHRFNGETSRNIILYKLYFEDEGQDIRHGRRMASEGFGCKNGKRGHHT